MIMGTVVTKEFQRQLRWLLVVSFEQIALNLQARLTKGQ